MEQDSWKYIIINGKSQWLKVKNPTYEKGILSSIEDLKPFDKKKEDGTPIEPTLEDAQLEKRRIYSDFFKKAFKNILVLSGAGSSMDVGGLSMGGMGTFELVARNPDYFAAAFPICGGGNPHWSNLLKRTPFWIFHGEDDGVVSVDFSRKMYEALSKEKASVRLTIYPKVNHNSWDNSFAEPDLMHWLFSNKR